MTTLYRVTTLYHLWSSMPAQRVRLGLTFKGVPHTAVPVHGEAADALFFELGVAHAPLALRLADGRVHTDPLTTLEGLDGWLGGPPLFPPALDPQAWRALLDWRRSVDAVLARLCAPVGPAFADVADDPDSLARYKRETERRFGMGVEALSNDRYDGYGQFERLAQLKALSRHLARERFYVGGAPSAADLLIACDLFPLQLLDGVSVPVDLLYYIERVERACGASPREGVVINLS